MRDDGAFCAKPEPYGRGGGYPWWFGDPLNDSKMFQRCESDHGSGQCEKNGLIVYPKCRSGYHAVGCCICSPDCPADLSTDIGVSCTKNTYGRGVGEPMSCRSNLEYDAGLCYQECKVGYDGIGPVCWGSCPSDYPVNCGAGCAVSTAACVESIINQVKAPFEVIANVAGLVASGGSSAAVTTGVKTAVKTGVKASLKAGLKNLADNLPQAMVESTANTALSVVQKGVQGQFNPKILASLDPTGIASAALSYALPICSPPAENAPSPVISVPEVSSEEGLSLVFIVRFQQ